MVEEKIISRNSPNRLFLPSLAFSAFGVNISNSLVSLLLIEIASTFQVNEGVAVQLRTVNAVAEVVFGLLMGFLAVRFRHKNLLLVGLSLVAFSAMGSFLAPTLELMLFFSFLEGTGSIVYTIVAFTLIGDLLPLDKKTRAVGWIIAAGYVFSFIGTPLIDLMANLGSWRYVFSLLVFPISIICLTLAIFGIPSAKTEKSASETMNAKSLLSSFKQVFLNKSVASCLIGGLFFTGTSFGVFAIAFYRLQFLISRTDSVYILLVIAFLAIVGSFIPARLGKRVSTKSLAVLSILGNGICTIMIFLAPSIWVALVFNFTTSVFVTIAISAYHCLVLEQVPQSRGTIMSLFRAATGMGYIIAPALAGSLLVLLSSAPLQIGYVAVGLGLGGMNIIAACIIYLFTKEHNKEES